MTGQHDEAGETLLRRWLVDDLSDARRRLADGVLAQIPVARRRELADGGGVAPVYVLWHLCRHHDIAVNGVLRGVDEVVHRHIDRLGIEDRLYRGLSEGADTDLVDVLDPGAVGDYALDLMDSTIAWLAAEAPLDDLDQPAQGIQVLQALGTPSDDFDWLYAMWATKDRRWFLSWEAIGHVVTHVGELISIRNRLGLSPF